MSQGDIWDCSWSCAYCQCHALPRDRKPLERETILAALSQRLQEDQAIEALTIAGNGEPSLHPNFASIVEGILALRNSIVPHAKIHLLTNGDGFVSGLDPADTKELATLNQAALDKIDHWFLKWDPGPRAGAWRSLTPTDIERRSYHWQKQQPLHLQGLVYLSQADTKEPGTNSNQSWHHWLADMQTLKPHTIDLMTVARQTTGKQFPVEQADLQARAKWIRQHLPQTTVRVW